VLKRRSSTEAPAEDMIVAEFLRQEISQRKHISTIGAPVRFAGCSGGGKLWRGSTRA